MEEKIMDMEVGGETRASNQSNRSRRKYVFS